MTRTAEIRRAELRVIRRQEQIEAVLAWAAALIVSGFALWWVITPARAEWPQFGCRAWRNDLAWHTWARRHCDDYRRRYHAQRHVSPADTTCHASVAAVGEQAQSESAAWDAAIVAWRGRVRWLHGERYSSPDAARDLIKACAPSSVPDAYRDAKLPALYRCEITARPCRTPPQRVGKDGDD